MRGRAIQVLLVLLLADSGRAWATSRVTAMATINIFHSAACNELDIDSTYIATVLVLENIDKGYPLGTWGELRTCGFIGVLLQQCNRSITSKQSGDSVTCGTYQHGAKCNKEYHSRADAFLGNQYYGIGASDQTNCDSEACIIAE